MKLLKAIEKFTWLEDAGKAFTELKCFLTQPLIMIVPQTYEALLLYIVATNQVVGTAIVIEREEARHAYKSPLPSLFYQRGPE